MHIQEKGTVLAMIPMSFTFSWNHEVGMIIKYALSMQGVRYYQVFEGEDDIFMGTLGECKRFISIHNAKVLERQAMERAARAS